MDIDILEEIGLTRGETKVYVSLLEIGPSKSGEIIRKSVLQNSVVFSCLKSLIEKGLVNFIIKGKIKEYSAVSPKILIDILEEKRSKLKLLIPQLKESKHKEKQEAKVYYGIKGVKTAHYDQIKISKKGEEYLFFSLENEYFNEEVKAFFIHYNNFRKKKGLNVKALIKENKKNKDIYNKEFYRGSIKFKRVKQVIPIGMGIFRDTVLQIVWDKEEPIAFLLKSKKLAEQYKDFFYFLW